MSRAYGVELDEDLAQITVSAWRVTNAPIKSFWYSTEEAAINAVSHPATTYTAGRLQFNYDRQNDFLRIKLPSGRLLCYYQPVLIDSLMPWGEYKQQLNFTGVNQVTRNIEVSSTYGGKIVENITQAVARDVLQGAILGDVDAALADDHGQLDLPVHVAAVGQHADRIVGSGEAAGRLEEGDRALGRLGAGLGGMVAVVQADADDLADPVERHAQAGRPLDMAEAAGVERLQTLDFAGRHGRGIDAADVAGQVTQLAVGIDQAGAFGAGFAITDEFHGGAPYNQAMRPPSTTRVWPVT
jgi:hypothetical protein